MDRLQIKNEHEEKLGLAKESLLHPEVRNFYRTAIGKIYLKLRSKMPMPYNTTRWEIKSTWTPSLTSNAWTPLYFQEENYKGDFVKLKDSSTIFRSQVCGTYDVKAMFAFAWSGQGFDPDNCYLGVFKNGLLVSLLDIWQNNLNVDGTEYFFTVIKVRGSDQVAALCGDEIEIKFRHDGAAMGAGTYSNIYGYVDFHFIDKCTKLIKEPIVNWSF